MILLNFIEVTSTIFTAVTLPLFIRGIWLDRKERNKKNISLNNISEVDLEGSMKSLQELLNERGINARVHSIPENASEAIVLQTQKIFDLIRSNYKSIEMWFKHITTKLDDNKKDIDALLNANTAMVKAIASMEERNGFSKNEPKSLDSYVHALQYAHDKFASNSTQKKALESVIRNIKGTHEPATK